MDIFKFIDDTNKHIELLKSHHDIQFISDGYHTFSELYEFRRLYNTALFNQWSKDGLYDVHKSKLHSDGKVPFENSNWFIVVAELPTGQISNHYTIDHWGSFQIPEKNMANEFDGHTTHDVISRLNKLLNDQQ